MRILFSIIFIFLCSQSYCQEEKVIKLKKSFKELEEEDKIQTQKLFFQLFPESFMEFESVFGFTNNNPAPLYSDSNNYLVKFFELDKISISNKLEKVINIGINGKWDADGVNYFQNNMRELIFRNTNSMYSILNLKTSKEIKSFFYFFFDEPHPGYNIFPKEFDQLKNIDEKFYNLIKEEHKKAVKNKKH